MKVWGLAWRLAWEWAVLALCMQVRRSLCTRNKGCNTRTTRILMLALIAREMTNLRALRLKANPLQPSVDLRQTAALPARKREQEGRRVVKRGRRPAKLGNE